MHAAVIRIWRQLTPPEWPNATSGGRGKNHKVPAPTVAPNVPGEQGTPPQGGGQGGNPRNLNKHAQGGDQNLPPVTPRSDLRHARRPRQKPQSARPNRSSQCSGRAGHATQSGGRQSRNSNKHAQGGDQNLPPTPPEWLTRRQEAGQKPQSARPNRSSQCFGRAGRATTEWRSEERSSQLE